jgi:hypothetical protein
VGSGHENARVGGTGYRQSREEIATIVHKWKWPDRTQGKSLWNIEGMKYFDSAEKNGGRFMIVRKIRQYFTMGR